MRKNQLSIKIERVSDQAKDGKQDNFEIYSDGQELSEVLARGLEKIRQEYFAQLDREEFFTLLLKVDTEADFFGCCETYADDE